MENNNITLIGSIESKFEYSHSVKDEDFYQVFVASRRKSGNVDVLPVIVSSVMVDVSMDLTGIQVEVKGSIRSYNMHQNGNHRLKLFVFTESFVETNAEDDNKFSFSGFVCRQPFYRETPLGRKISETIVGVNRQYGHGKSDYIPSIGWSRNAMYLTSLDIGEQISGLGRFQSRSYRKRLDNDTFEDLVTYEVSIVFLNYKSGSDECAGEV